MVETFGETVSLWVVRSCATLFDARDFAEFFDELAFKISTLIGMYSHRKAIVLYYLLPEDLCNCVCFLVSRREGLSVLGEMICHHQYVFIASSQITSQRWANVGPTKRLCLRWANIGCQR